MSTSSRSDGKEGRLEHSKDLGGYEEVKKRGGKELQRAFFLKATSRSKEVDILRLVSQCKVHGQVYSAWLNQ